MYHKTRATYQDGDALLVGTTARDTWRAQQARCNCGCYGDADHAMSGTAGDMPAVWLGCPNCRGQALGKPLVYRLPSQIVTSR